MSSGATTGWPAPRARVSRRSGSSCSRRRRRARRSRPWRPRRAWTARRSSPPIRRRTTSRSRAGEYEGRSVRSATRVTRAVLEAGHKLEVVGRAGAGVDTIDVDAATERGVVVMNTPGSNTTAVAEHTLALLLALARRVPEADAALKAGRWEKSRLQGVELFGKVLGVLGLGRIGSEVARRALGFRMHVLADDPYLTREAAERHGVEAVDLAGLPAPADFITLHVPLTGDTRHLLGEDALARVKPGVRIINCARGGIVAEQPLADAIRATRVAGAALHVFEQEPP